MQDCHIHIALDGIDYRKAVKDGFSESLIRSRLQSYSESGANFLRDGGDNNGASLFAAKIAGEYGIDFRSPAFAIYKSGHYGSIVGKAFESPNELKSLIAQAKSLKADFIKIMATGIMDFAEYGRLTPGRLTYQEMKLAIDIAHGEGLSVMAHANGNEAVYDLCRAGADSIEHGYFIDKEGIGAIVESKCCWVPTLAPLERLVASGAAESGVIGLALSGQLDAIAIADGLGAIIAAGSDAGSKAVFHVEGAKLEPELISKSLKDAGKLAVASEWVKERFKRW